ncbi:MAG: carbohydrate ABC transporter permease [Acetanaerobacterium sp.]
MNKNAVGGKVAIHTLLILGSVTMLMPFVWMILTSLKSLSESMAVPPTFIIRDVQWINYSDVINKLPFVSFYVNTLLMILFRVLFAVIFSSMAAYAFARIKFPGNNFFFMLVLIQMMMPSQIFIIPQYLIVSKLNLLNTVSALVVPGVVSAFGTFLLRQFFLGLPTELEEAGILDGCNRWKLFTKIMLPLAKSGCVSLGIFTALFAYKDLLWPLIVNMDITKMPLSAGLASLQGQYLTNYPQLMAGAMIAIWPMLIIFLVFQKQFIQGIATTGSKN